MSAAIVAGVVVAGVGAYVSYDSAQTAAKATQSGADSAEASAANNLAFQQQVWTEQMDQVAALEDIFGPVRENLNQYYKDMTAEQFQLSNKVDLERQYERTNKNIDAIFSNNNMFGSGQDVNARIALEGQREIAMGDNQRKSNEQYQAQQMNWLNSGINEMNSARGLAGQTQGQIGNAFNTQANIALSGSQAVANSQMTLAQGYADVANGGMNLVGYGVQNNTGGFGSSQVWGSQPGGVNSSDNISYQLALANAGK